MKREQERKETWYKAPPLVEIGEGPHKSIRTREKGEVET